MMKKEEIEKRVERAKELFKQGVNCSQSGFAACADLYGIEDEALALRLSASFGGGIGRMRETCGAACGMFMLAGLALVQDLAAKFRDENGSLRCAELLGIKSQEQGTKTNDPTPAPRTEEYYKKRPCVEMVASAVRIFLENK